MSDATLTAAESASLIRRLEHQGGTIISATDLTELQRKAAAYDAGVSGFGVRGPNGLLPSSTRAREHDAESSADYLGDLIKCQYQVVPVRIVEELK